jgi:hypothetical protein
MNQRRKRLRRKHLAHGELRAWGLEVLLVLATEPFLLLLLLMQLLEGILFGLFVDCVGAVRTYFGAPKHMCELLKRRRSSFASTTDFLLTHHRRQRLGPSSSAVGPSSC